MKTLYFKSSDGIFKTIKERESEGLTAEWGIVNCDCGESSGVRIMDKDLNTVERLIECEDCYKNAPNYEKGE